MRRALLDWFAVAKRPLPWREGRDPYAVWVSEIMLQQTRVDTVQPFFTRWMARFPTVRALAEAPLDEVLAHWSGLGYYARARNLHAAARQVVTNYGGQIPAAVDAVRALPGVGPYTAGAIASIAFGAAEPLVDGNVARVLARLEALEGAVDSPAFRREAWRRAAVLVRADAGKQAGELNQALMELGATVCAPQSPQCAACPLRSRCRAYAAGAPTRYPAPKVRRAPAVVQAIAVLVERDGKRLLLQRPPRGLWGGLWEPPMSEVATADADAAAALVRRCAGLTLSDLKPLESFEHVLTHRRIQFVAFRARASGRVRLDGYEACRWHDRLDPAPLGVAAWTRRLLQKELS